jgi:hypothetical protein
MSGDYDELTEEERKRLYGERKFVGKVSRTETGGISIDVSGIGDAVNEEELEAVESETLERVKADRDDLKAKLQLIAEKQFEKTKKELGAPEEFETVEELEAWRREHAEERTRNPALSGEPSSHESANVKNYPNIESMISDLNERSRSNIPEVREEAQQILKQLHAKASKSKNVPFEREIDLMKLVEDKRKKAKERGETLEHWSEL